MSARASSRSRDSRGPTARRPPRRTALANNMIRISVVMGLALLVPGVWAVAVLAGLSVPMSAGDSAPNMAMVMLLCWPVGLILLGGAVYYNRLFNRAEATQTRRSPRRA